MSDDLIKVRDELVAKKKQEEAEEAAWLLARQKEYAVGVIKQMFSNYDQVTNPDYSFIINKRDVDELIQSLKEGNEDE